MRRMINMIEQIDPATMVSQQISIENVIMEHFNTEHDHVKEKKNFTKRQTQYNGQHIILDY
jgi:hypothetical protein